VATLGEPATQIETLCHRQADLKSPFTRALTAMSFNVSLYQIIQGYRYFRGEPLPGDVCIQQAGCDLLRDFGHDRVKTVLLAMRAAVGDDEAVQAAGRRADQGQ
jgi:hypothetical protein